MDDSSSEKIVRRLARPRPAGGHVVERAAVLAEGPHCADIEAWILSHGGEAEEVGADDEHDGGIFAARSTLTRPGAHHPARYVLPAGTLSTPL